MFKVLHLIDSGGLYGAETVLLELMSEQVKIGLCPVLLSLGVPGISKKPLEILAKQRKLKVERLRMRKGLNICGALSILKLGKNRGINLIHCHGYKANILMGVVPRFLRGIPVVSTLHGWTTTKILSKKALIQLLDLLCFKNIDRTVLVSSAMLKNRMIKALNIKPVVVHNGISKLSFIKGLDRNIDPDLINFCKSSFVIGSIGRLSPEKGFKFLIDAMELLIIRGYNIRLIIIGEGTERGHLEAKISKMKLNNYILLPGFIPNAFQLLPLFKVFVLPSLGEGLPITLLEAMQAGLPIVASGVGGVVEVLDNGECGMLVEPGDVDALYSALMSMYLSKEHREKLGLSVRKRAAEYSSDRMALAYLSIYKEVCNRCH